MINRKAGIAASMWVFAWYFFLGIAQEKEQESTRLESLRFKFDVVRAELAKPLTDLNANYQAQLKKLEAKVQEEGDLDKLVAIRNELKGFTEDGGKLAENFPRLSKLQKIYRQEHTKREQARAEKLKPLLEAYAGRLAGLEKELTRAGKVDQALKVREEAKWVGKASQNVVARLGGGEPDDPGGASPEVALKRPEGGKLLTFGTNYYGKPVTANGVEDIDRFVSVVNNYSFGWYALTDRGAVWKDGVEVDGMERRISAISRGANWNIGVLGITTKGDVVLGSSSLTIPREVGRELEGVVDLVWNRKGLLAVKSDGTLVHGAFDKDVSRPGSRPPPPETMKDVKAVASWIYVAHVLKNDGSVISWEIGGERREVPKDLPKLTAIAAGQYFGLGLSEEGKVVAWGVNSRGQLDIPENLGECIAVRAGGYTSAARRKDGSWVAWGDDYKGTLEKINSLKKASDIVFSVSSHPDQNPHGFVVWIE